MNGTTTEPEGLDDPALLAEIEAEFAELTAEIQRISAMPSHVGPRKSELLEALRASWRERLKAKTGDRPEWRQKLDETISRAVDRLLEDGIVENADGSLGFALRGDTIQSEGGPLLRGLLDGLSHMLTEKFPPPAPAAQGGSASAEANGAAQAAAANPLAGLLGGLGQVLAGALKSAVAQVGAQVPGGLSKLGDTTVEAKLPNDGGELKVVVKPAETAAESITPGTTVDMGAVDFHGEQKVAASFEFDSRKSAGTGGGEGDGQAAGQTSGQSGPNAFFQQLFAGLGQVMRQALTPQPTAPPPAATTTATSPQEAAQPTEGTSAQSTETSAQAPTQPAPQPAPSPFGGLGQLFFDAIQKAFTPPAPGTSTPPSQGTESTPTAPHDEAPPADGTSSTEATAPNEASSEGAPTEAMNVRIPQVNAENKPEGEPAPALNIDLAGLLRQVLGGIKPPS